MRRTGLGVIFCTLLILCACASNSATAGGDLTGVTWVLDQASMMTLVDTVPVDARIDIAFDGAQVHGRAACNSYGGGYQSGDGALTFDQFISTQVACEMP
ncbi:MAG: META domain-containing protein [Actinomycetota bacterium]